MHHDHIFSYAVSEVLESKPLAEASEGSVTVPQFHLLKIIALEGRHQVGQLAKLLGVTSPAVSKNIQKLERLGLVTRRRSTGDRRVTLLRASEKGHRLVEHFDELVHDRLDWVLDDLSDEDFEELNRLLERLYVLLYEHDGSPLGFCLRCAAYGDADCQIADMHGVCPYIEQPGAETKER